MRPHIPELLDLGTELPGEIARSLAYLRRMNRWLGGYSALLSLLAGEPASSDFTLLDVGAGSGDAAVAVRRRFPRARVVLCDLKRTHLPRHGCTAVATTAWSLPFADRSFDYVSASLLLHQLRDEGVVEALRDFGRVARRAVVVSDLERHWFPRVFLWLSAPVFARSFITRHDGVASIRQGFRPQELRALAQRAGFDEVGVRRRLPWFRLAMVARRAR